MATKRPTVPPGQHQNVEYVPIRVTAGILLHIGAGIYQSVAGAIKELVSNAYDADSTQVVISTNYPRFDEMVIVDNGSGMTPKRFTQAMRSIGSSLKAVLDEERQTPKYKRPVIGHLGIGLMALSQVCSEATIESQAEGSDKKFVATLDFSEFKSKAVREIERIKLEVLQERYGGVDQMKKRLRQRDIDAETKDDIRTALGLIEQGEKKPTKTSKPLEGEHLGYCLMYTDLPAINGEHGTTITLKQIDRPVRDLLTDVGRELNTLPQIYRDKFRIWSEYRDQVNEWSWEVLCQRLRTETSGITYQLLPKYHQFLWELSVMTPVPYLSGGPITLRSSILAEKKSEIDQFNFALRVDNRLLLKPILLPSGSFPSKQKKLEARYDYLIERTKFDKVVDHERLRYDGYIFWQRKQIQPSSIRGLQIYIRNVGIGHYDDSFMKFSTVNLTSRAGQMSGEIYVEEGLERALNVDRNSFRETDEHYTALQQHIWNVLGTAAEGEGVIGRSIESYWLRKARADAEDQEDHIAVLKELVTSASKGRIDLSFSEQSRTEPYRFVDSKITIYDGSPRWPRSRSERHLSQRILIPARVAVEIGAPSSRLIELLESLILK